jgi:hypothetical protein
MSEYGWGNQLREAPLPGPLGKESARGDGDLGVFHLVVGIVDPLRQP